MNIRAENKQYVPEKVVFVTDILCSSDAYDKVVEASDNLTESGLAVCIIDSAAAKNFFDKVEAYQKCLLLTDDEAQFAQMSEAGFNVIGMCIEDTEKIPDFKGSVYVFSDIARVDVDSYIKAYQRIKGYPWFILETQRCLVRETTIDDIDSFYKIYSDPSMTEYMEGLFENPDDERKYTADYISKVYGLMGFGVWTVVDKKSGEIMGRAGFSIRGGFEDIELGFLIAVPFQGRGYATEVCSAIMNYGKEELGFDHLLAFVKKDNIKSIHVCEKLGFKPEDEVRLEENIYGDSYNGTVVSMSPVHYGNYCRMICRI